MRAFPTILAPLAFVVPALISSIYPPSFVEPPSAVVLVTMEGGHGTGVHIGGGYVLTAAHVVTTETTATLKTERGVISKADVIWSNKEADLALVQTKHFADFGTAELACRRGVKGEAVNAQGNPFDYEFLSTWGYVSGPPRIIGTAVLLPTDMTVAPGMSGGPVYDSAGKIIGFSNAYLDGTSLSFLVPSEVACRFLAREVL